MANISTWSTTAANNNSNSPDGAPEGMAPSGVNDTLREIMAAVRRWYEDSGWIDLGLTPTRTGTTTFEVPGDYTTQYHVGRRVRMSGSSTVYAPITATAYAAGVTSVTVGDNSVPSTLSAVAISEIYSTNTNAPASLPNKMKFTASGGGTDSAVKLESDVPSISWVETDAGTDAKNWDIVALTEQLTFRAYNDASTTASNYLVISRSGATVSKVQFPTGYIYSEEGTATGASGDVLTLTTLSDTDMGVYLVSAALSGVDDAANYSCTSIVATNGTTAKATALMTATLLSISMSGMTIQGTQTSGISSTITYRVLRIG